MFRDDEVSDLQMDPELFCKDGGLKHRSQFCAGNVMIEFFSESLDIDIRSVQPGSNVPEGFRGHVTVGYVDGRKPRVLCQLCAFVCILVPDRGLVVGPGNGPRTRDKRPFHQLFREDVPGIGIFHTGLGNGPVLAVFAAEVASDSPH